MSTATLDAPAAAARSGSHRPPLARLIGVELRKAVDTRAGFWLVLVTGLLTIAVTALLCIFGEPEELTFPDMLSLAVQPASILLPVIGVLLVTSEWSQRTAQVTFALVPQRLRIVNAKLLGGLAIALAAFVVCLLVALVATLLFSPDAPARWTDSAAFIGQSGLSTLLGMLMGIALGAAILNSAAAIVAYFALPIVSGILSSFSFMDEIGKWIDPIRALDFTSNVMDGTEWARAGTCLLLWLVLPLAIGVWRIRRAEVN